MTSEVRDEFLGRAHHLVGRGGPVEHRLAVALDRHREVEVVGVADGLWRGDAGADSGTPVVDLGLREVERVLALDRPARHVVADGVAHDLAPEDHDREFGFGDVPVRVASDPDGLARSHRSLGGRLEEDLRAFVLEGTLVHLATTALLLACVAADLVGHARGPDLVGHRRDRDVLDDRTGVEQRCVVDDPLGHLVDGGSLDLGDGGEVDERGEPVAGCRQVVGLLVVADDELRHVIERGAVVSHGHGTTSLHKSHPGWSPRSVTIDRFTCQHNRKEKGWSAPRGR